jgi:hypothetical protein
MAIHNGFPQAPGLSTMEPVGRYAHETSPFGMTFKNADRDCALRTSLELSDSSWQCIIHPLPVMVCLGKCQA